MDNTIRHSRYYLRTKDNISEDDIIFFHRNGAHGNNLPNANGWKPDLFREDCPICQYFLYVAGMDTLDRKVQNA